MLGVESFGLYTVALSYYSLVSTLAEFGINRYLIREIAINQQKTPLLLTSVTMLRLTLATLAFSVFAIITAYLDPDNIRKAVTILAVSTILPQSIAFTLDSVFIGLQKFLWSAFGFVVLNIATTILGLFFIYNGTHVLGAVSALVLGQVVYVVFLALLPLRHGINFLKSSEQQEKAMSLKLIKEITKDSLPYGLLGILGLIYFKIDSLLLSYLKPAFEVGIYGAAYRFLEAIVVVPSVVATAMFPVLAKLHTENIHEIKKLYLKSLVTLFITSSVALVLYVSVLPILITNLLPQYQPAVKALSILSLAIPFMFIHVPGAIVLLSTNKYLKDVIMISLFTVSFNIVANLLLIPKYGYMGASVVTVLSEILTFIIFFTFLQLRVFKSR